MKPPARSVIVLFDIEHEVDLDACRRRAASRAAELLASGKTGSLRGVVAEAAGVDYKTVATFLDGGRVSAEKLIAIIEHGLGLKFADVVKPAKVA